MKLVRGLLTDSLGRRPEDGVDDKVRDAGEVVEPRDEVLSEGETGDEQLQGLARDLTVDAGDDGLLAADAGVEGQVLGAVVTPRAPAAPRARVATVATNVDTLRARGSLDTDLKMKIFNEMEKLFVTPKCKQHFPGLKFRLYSLCTQLSVQKKHFRKYGLWIFNSLSQFEFSYTIIFQ